MQTTVKKLVINASPLICLFGAELEFVLQKSAQEVLVPSAVWQEVLANPGSDRASELIGNTPWLKKVDVLKIDQRVAEWGLGSGETQVLSLAVQSPGDLVVIDDAEARRCAKTIGLNFMGTGGLLIVAKRLGVIRSVTESIHALQESGLWISKEISMILREQANEL